MEVRMHWVLWPVAMLVVLAAGAWIAAELVPFVLYPLIAAACLLAGWRIARRARTRGV
ncbi:MAG TPA: hypothetical protein VFQ45_06735 [Longimicrobium sp.]|nr:hypothetical protein [Longimicrobium sp.]